MLLSRTVPPGTIALFALLYLLVPGHPGVPLAGIPIGQTGVVAAVAIAGGWWWCRGSAPSAVPLRALAVLLACGVIKIALLASVPAPGWLARYYANDRFEPPVRRSIDFLRLPATRIDPRLSFVAQEFPVHFFNDPKADGNPPEGVNREYTQPFSVHWMAHVWRSPTASTPLKIEAKGQAWVEIDGREVARVASPVAVPPGPATATATQTFDLAPGAHSIELRYAKPPEMDGMVSLSLSDGSPLSQDSVFASAAAPWQRQLWWPSVAAAWVVHATALAVVVGVLGPAIRRKVRAILAAREKRVLVWQQLVGPVVVTLLVAQGLVRSNALVGHVWTMSGGDDWLTYELAARDTVLNGILQTEGAELGKGKAFWIYPGYSYFVALIHLVVGESVAGVILVNFLVLAIATLIVYRLGRLLVGPEMALVGLLWLLVLEQLDFVRYYTVTLLSENLYIALVAASVVWLAEYVGDGRWSRLLGAGLMGGLASITRPSMMLFLPLAMLIVLIASWRRHRGARAAAEAVGLMAAWLAAVSPITLRNYVVSGDPVLITQGQAVSFIVYNMPFADLNRFLRGFDGTMWSAARMIVRMFIDYPAESLANYFTKLGFSLGMVHWMGSGGRPHPELVLTSVMYFFGILTVPAARTLAALPLHCFVLTHLVTLMATMPSNYGYRMLLPMYQLMPIVAAAGAVKPFGRFLLRRGPHRSLAATRH